MKGKLLGLIPLVNLPFLPGDAKPANRRASELEPVATLVKHESGIFVVIILGGSGL